MILQFCNNLLQHIYHKTKTLISLLPEINFFFLFFSALSRQVAATEGGLGRSGSRYVFFSLQISENDIRKYDMIFKKYHTYHVMILKNTIFLFSLAHISEVDGRIEGTQIPLSSLIEMARINRNQG